VLQAHLKSFYVVKIRPNPLKSVEIWAKSPNTFTKSLEVWANTWKCEQQMCPTAPKITQKSFFWKSLCFYSDFFRANSGEFRQKSFPAPQICLLLHIWLDISLYCLLAKYQQQTMAWNEVAAIVYQAFWSVSSEKHNVLERFVDDPVNFPKSCSCWCGFW